MYAEGMSADALPPEQPIRGQTVLLPTPPPGGFTARDLPRLIEAVDARFELLDGEVLMMAPATPWHHEVVDILKHALRQIAPQSVVIVAEMGVDLDHTVPEPGDQVFLAGGEPGRRDGRIHLRVASRGKLCANRYFPQPSQA
jgi:hypothetical protein